MSFLSDGEGGHHFSKPLTTHLYGVLAPNGAHDRQAQKQQAKQ
jgi:hypothetical protein